MDTYPNVALIGKAGAGKTTTAEILERGLQYHRFSFADPLKDLAAFLWDEDARKDRSKLQTLGVSAREIDHDVWVNLLIRRIDGAKERTAYAVPGSSDGFVPADDPLPPVIQRPSFRVAIDDCRFPNEYWRLKEEGFVVVRITAPRSLRIDRLTRNGKLTDEAQLEHESEIALDDFEADYTIANDGTTDELIERVREVMFREAVRS